MPSNAMSNRMKIRAAIVLVTAYLAGSGVAWAATVGHVVTEGAKVDGLEVPPGTTLVSPARVETTSSPAIIHLGTGQALALGQNSAAVVETDREGLYVALESGTAAVREETSGEVITLADNSTLLLEQDGQVQEGAPVASTASLCVLSDTSAGNVQRCHADPDGSTCDWELTRVPASQAQSYLDQGAVYAGKSNNALGLDADCEGEVAGAVVAAAGMSTLAKVGIGAAAVAGGIIIYEEFIKDDDEPGASPTTPN